MAKSRQLFECRKHLGQPCLKERALDLDDIPVQDQKRDSTDAVDREERHRRGVIVGSGLGGCVDDCEDGVASGWKGKRLVVNEQLLAAEEGDARPIDELGEIFLGVDQRVVTLAQIFVKPRTAGEPSLNAFIAGPFRKERVIQSRSVKFMKSVLRVRANVVKEIVRVPAG